MCFAKMLAKRHGNCCGLGSKAWSNMESNQFAHNPAYYKE